MPDLATEPFEPPPPRRPLELVTDPVFPFPAVTPSTRSMNGNDVSAAFAPTRFSFMTGLRAGETARVRDGEGETLFAYRSFASIVGVVATLMAGVVFVTGLAAVIFLMSQGRPLTAALAVMLSVGFAAVIAMLVPPIRVELTENGRPVLAIVQTSPFSFPSALFSVTGNDPLPLARIHRSVFSRLGRNRWTLLHPGEDRIIGRAIEESLGRALIRKVAGKFRHSLDANVTIECEGQMAGTIIRRPDSDGNADYLELPAGSPIDRRLAVALATLILGSEP